MALLDIQKKKKIAIINRGNTETATVSAVSLFYGNRCCKSTTAASAAAPAGAPTAITKGNERHMERNKSRRIGRSSIGR